MSEWVIELNTRFHLLWKSYYSVWRSEVVIMWRKIYLIMYSKWFVDDCSIMSLTPGREISWRILLCCTSITAGWMNTKSRRFYCLGLLMNRYLMVQRDDNITVFYDEFINYGFNKITYVEKLRYSNFSFYLASKLYAFDLPHHGYDLLIGIRE